MNWDRVEGNWKQFTGKVKEQWGKLTEDDLTVIDGKQEQLVGRIQERYGVAKDEAEKQVKTGPATFDTASLLPGDDQVTVLEPNRDFHVSSWT